MRDRYLDIKRVNCLYQRKFSHADWCIYCGDAATTQDHVYPISVASAIMNESPESLNSIRRRLIVVPCCISCNMIAGNRIFRGIKDKREYIKKKLLKKLYKMRAVRWDDEDLSSIGHSLRTYIVSKQNDYDALRRRVLWPKRAD